MARRSAGAKKATTTTIGGLIGCGINHVVNPLLQHFGLAPVPPDVTPFITGGLGVACGAAFDTVAEKIHSAQEKNRAESREQEVRSKLQALDEFIREAADLGFLSVPDYDDLERQIRKSFVEWEARLLSIDDLDATLEIIYGEYRKRAGLLIPKRSGRKKAKS